MWFWCTNLHCQTRRNITCRWRFAKLAVCKIMRQELSIHTRKQRRILNIDILPSCTKSPSRATWPTAALISDSMDLSQTPDEAARPWTRSQPCRTVGLFTPQLTLVPSYTAWRHRQCACVWTTCPRQHSTALGLNQRLQEIFKDNVTGGDIRLKGHGRGVTGGTLESRLPARHYAICIYCWTSFFCYVPQI